MPAAPQAAFDATLDAIYDAAVAPATWPAALKSLADLFHCSFADRFQRDHNRTHHRGVAHGIDDADYQTLFLDTWAKRNVWSNRRPTTTAGEIVTTRDILPADELVGTEMFNDYLDQRDLHDGMRLALWAGLEGIEDISLLRPFSIGAFTSAETETAARLLPHLRRAAAISRRMQAAEAEASGSRAALDSTHQPMILLQPDGRIAHANAAALDVLRRADGLVYADGGLAGATSGVTARIRALVHRAAGLRTRALAGSMWLPRPSGDPALGLVIVPLDRDRDRDWLLPSPPAMLASIADPSARPVLAGTHLAALFALTPAEAALAHDLLDGETVIAIARRTGRSVNTVRTHLSRLMTKTGTTRQADLTRLLLAFPRA